MTEMKKVTLVCTEGGANKQYTVWIEQKGKDLYSVESQYGPVGGWVQSACKTPQPVTLDKATKLYSKLVGEKKGKGYHEGADAPAFSQVKDAVDSGLRPMLLTDASEEGPEEFILSPKWGAQEKINGKRIMLRTGGGRVIGVNRRGLECPIPVAIQKAFSPTRSLVLDGELVGDVYYAFDILEGETPGGSVDDLRSLGTAVRHLVLEGPEWLAEADDDEVKVVPLVTGEKAKRKLVESLRAGRREGVVFKKLDAPYEPGRRENPKKAIAVKCKFYKEIAAVVIRFTDKSSVEIALQDGNATVPVGKVTVPAKYIGQIMVGGRIRVRYLYATPARKLYQANIDPTDDGSVVAEQVDSISALQFEGKEEE
jgi:bifunctional non-homologous end joining protein LigD